VATSKLTEQDVDKLLHMVVRATSRVDPEPDWADLLPAGYTGTPGEDGADEALFFRRHPHLFRLEPGAAEAARVLAHKIRTQRQTSDDADEEDLFVEILDAVCAVVAGDQKMKGLGKRLLSDVSSGLFRSVNVLPVGGLTLSDSDKPLHLGKAMVIGPLAEATVAAVSQLTSDEVGVGMALSNDTWWAEDLFGFRSDPAAYDHVPPETGISLVAVTVDAVGAVAAVRARQMVEAILGAVWLVEKHRTEWPSGTPWIVGRPTMVESPRTLLI
jgi:hypothetical protein